MPILDPIRLGITPCVCGRLSTKLHCSNCGSYVIRGVNKKNTRVDQVTLESTEYQCYRCRVCMTVFDDWEWRNECKAPPFETHSSRLHASFKRGNMEEISENIRGAQLPKGMTNKGKPFAATDVDRALSVLGLKETRMRAFKQSSQEYDATYEEKWRAFDVRKGNPQPSLKEIKTEEETEGE